MPLHPPAELDTLRCPHRGSEMQIIAWIKQSEVISKILRNPLEALLPVADLHHAAPPVPRLREVLERCVRGTSGVIGYKQVFVDDLSEDEWERWRRGMKGDTRVLGEGFVGTELGDRNQDKLGHRPRKPNRRRLGFIEPTGESGQSGRRPACEETAGAGHKCAHLTTDS